LAECSSVFALRAERWANGRRTADLSRIVSGVAMRTADLVDGGIHTGDAKHGSRVLAAVLRALRCSRARRRAAHPVITHFGIY
jgi:hypothetical protein